MATPIGSAPNNPRMPTPVLQPTKPTSTGGAPRNDPGLAAPPPLRPAGGVPQRTPSSVGALAPAPRAAAKADASLVQPISAPSAPGISVATSAHPSSSATARDEEDARKEEQRRKESDSEVTLAVLPTEQKLDLDTCVESIELTDRQPSPRPDSPSRSGVPKMAVTPEFFLHVARVEVPIPGTASKQYYQHVYFPCLENSHYRIEYDPGQKKYRFKNRGSAPKCWKWRLPDALNRGDPKLCERDCEEFAANLREAFRLFEQSRVEPVRSLRRAAAFCPTVCLPLTRALQADIKQYFENLSGDSQRAMRNTWAADMLASRTAYEKQRASSCVN